MTATSSLVLIDGPVANKSFMAGFLGFVPSAWLYLPHPISRDGMCAARLQK
jgi:hypothetical protein